MEKIQLKSSARNLEADRAEKLNQAGQIPAELYGHNIANLHITLDRGEFERVLRKAGESTIVELTAPDGQVRNVLIHDVQRHYLSSQPIHVDFYEVKMTERLTATVALEYVGESKAVREGGGTLVKVLTEVEVECLPADLPHNIEVDITSLTDFDKAILVKDLKVSDKVDIKTDAEETVAKVQPPRNVEAELAAEAAPVMDVSQVEVVGAEAKADEEAAAENEPKEK